MSNTPDDNLTKKRKPRPKKYNIDEVELDRLLFEYSSNDKPMTNRLGKLLFDLVIIVSRMPAWIGYSPDWKDAMVSTATLRLVKYTHNYRREKVKKPSSYIFKITSQAFIEELRKLKKEHLNPSILDDSKSVFNDEELEGYVLEESIHTSPWNQYNKYQDDIREKFDELLDDYERAEKYHGINVLHSSMQVSLIRDYVNCGSIDELKKKYNIPQTRIINMLNNVKSDLREFVMGEEDKCADPHQQHNWW